MLHFCLRKPFSCIMSYLTGIHDNRVSRDGAYSMSSTVLMHANCDEVDQHACYRKNEKVRLRTEPSYIQMMIE